MSMDVGGGRGGVKADINVTPLVDVMLVLLIIMMLVAPLVQQGVSIKLPTASNTAEMQQSSDQTIVAVAANGDMYLNAKQVAKGDLAVKVGEALQDKKNSKENPVLIQGDQDAAYGSIMAAMDELRTGGIENVALITDPRRSRDKEGGSN